MINFDVLRVRKLNFVGKILSYKISQFLILHEVKYINLENIFFFQNVRIFPNLRMLILKSIFRTKTFHK